jgi:2-dehydropantoate 2-reductase
MRLLVLGAGATGGYFGGRLAEAGRDVSFLVRPARAAALAAGGLHLKSPAGDATLPVKTVVAAGPGYDAVLLSCKAYDLAGAIEAIRPAMGGETFVVPLLNGLAHFAALDAAFGPARVLGGLCYIGATLGAGGEIVHTNTLHTLAFGERAGGRSTRVEALAKACLGARFDHDASENVMQALWEKFAMIAALAGMTSLMRAPVGDIVAAAEGADLMREAYDECAAVARAAGHPIRPKSYDNVRAYITAQGSLFGASMFRDIEAGNRVEGEHILGDMLARARAAGIAAPLLRVAQAHVQAYEARKRRLAGA